MCLFEGNGSITHFVFVVGKLIWQETWLHIFFGGEVILKFKRLMVYHGNVIETHIDFTLEPCHWKPKFKL
jgi:hypothetical protein